MILSSFVDVDLETDPFLNLFDSINNPEIFAQFVGENQEHCLEFIRAISKV